ncbi:MAG: 30S ribosomal protein S20, partial [Clostridia bacterium]|nr:30S ribosomal protein S20 [Clostridia bacterium]
IKKIDQAVAKGLLHKNTAARKKSALAKKANA